MNYDDFFGRLGGRENGGNQRVLDVLENVPVPWVWTPTFTWSCRLLASELQRGLKDAALTQTMVITVASANMASARVTLVFSNAHEGGPLDGDVTITADASESDDENALAAAIDTAIDGNAALSAIFASVGTATNQVIAAGQPGQGLVECTITVEEAHVEELTFAGTMVDGNYETVISGGGLANPVTVRTTRTGAVPSTAAAMAIQHEADIEARIATSLAGVVQSADDDGAGVNALQFEPGIDPVTVETRPPLQQWTVTVGSTGDADYSTTFNHYSLPGGSHTVTTPVVGGSPAGTTAIATQHQADVEADIVLAAAGLIDNAASSSAGAVCTFTTPSGISGLTLDNDESDGTMTSDETSLLTRETAADVGTAVSVAHFVLIDLNVAKGSAFPGHAKRKDTALEITTGFGVGRNVYVGQNGTSPDVDALLGSISANTTGRFIAQDSVAEYDHRYEQNFVPTATLELGSTVAMTAGDIEVQIDFSPAPGRRFAA